MRMRFIPALLLVALMSGLGGCLFDTTLDETGGGTMKIEARVSPTDTLEKVKARYKAPGVEVTKATMDDARNVVVELTFKDFATLGAARAFENVTFSLSEDRKAGTRTATAVMKNARPVTLPPDQLEYFGKDVKLAITVPGDIVKTNGSKSGKRVTWTEPLNTMLGKDAPTFSITYKHSGPPLGASATGSPVAGTPQAAAAGTPAPKK